jgi:predicted MFS family arabinose efflux permease
MRGYIIEYFVIYMLMHVISATTTAAVYNRIIAERFETARGLALAFAITGPAAVAAVGNPLLIKFIDAYGWRAGFQALAVFSAVVGGICLLLVPPSRKPAPESAKKSRQARHDYPVIMRNPAFWIMLSALILSNLFVSLPTTQLNLILQSKGIASTTAGMIFSLYAIGSIAGRFICGFALDRLSAPMVAAVSMGLPSVGLVILATELNLVSYVALSVFLIGLSQGAEGDLIAFLVVRYFGMDLFGSVTGLLIGSLGFAAAFGSMILSLTLKLNGTFTLFFIFSAVTVFIGGSLFMLLGWLPIARPAA